MNDRELLELAGKAAGWYAPPPESERVPDDVPLVMMLHGKQWNPLADDGDALRLAVSLEIVLSFERPNEVSASRPGDWWEFPEEWAEHSGDRNAATRRAIVRCAAAIGQH